MLFLAETKSLKDQLKVERREYLLKEVQNLYEEDYFINTLKIPQENVKGFQYYSIEDAEFVKTLKAKKNKWQIFCWYNYQKNTFNYSLMKTNFLIACFLIVQLVFSQEKIIHGKVTGSGNNVEGINVVNLVNEKSAVTNEAGEFRIMAKEDDLLVLSALNFEYKRKIINAEDLKIRSGKLFEMIPKA